MQKLNATPQRESAPPVKEQKRVKFDSPKVFEYQDREKSPEPIKEMAKEPEPIQEPI
jgi:hypothetical protein